MEAGNFSSMSTKILTTSDIKSPMGFKTSFLAMMELMKLRMTLHILITVFIGFYMASMDSLDWIKLGWTLLGSGLLAVSCFCMNQALEKEFDSVMQRTLHRPLPTQRLTVFMAFTMGGITGLLGVGVLCQFVNLLSAAIGGSILFLYAAVYTPMKRTTTLNTLVGAIPGALPPLLGWTAVSGQVGWGGMILFSLLFFWQLPHFLALAWMYKEDYRRGGFKMLSLVDEKGEVCFRQIEIQSLLLAIVSLFPFWLGMAGGVYLLSAMVLGIALLVFSRILKKSGTREAAVRLFLFSILYLPVLLGIMAIDKRMLLIG